MMPRMFLNGTAMSGQADHHAVAGATFIGAAHTAPRYRLIAVRDAFPGLLDAGESGGSIVGELYEMEESLLVGTLLPAEPDELELDTIELLDGEIVNSMCLRLERLARDDRVVDITALGGWRAYQRFLSDNLALPELRVQNR
jgi:gamma-glutamylcyclotransferase (GGCT)/AIG2-like uncharacterized protein YtfP